jgi:hypothetical protein
MTVASIPHRDARLSILVGLATMVAAAALMAVILSYLVPDSPVPSKPFNAGEVDSFAPGGVIHFRQQHFYLVRLDSGEFLAFYDLDPYQQSRAAIFPKARDCRLEWFSPVTLAQAGLQGSPGAEGGIFREPCQLNSFDKQGNRLYGPVPSGLDRYEVTVSSQVTVDLARVVCGLREDGSRRACAKAAHGF